MSNENGMCPTLSDKEFFDLLTNNGTEIVPLVIKHYPELRQFVE